MSITDRWRLVRPSVAFRILVVTYVCAHGSLLAAQGENYAAIRATKRAAAVRIDEPIYIDGRIDESVWLRAQPAVEFYQQAPDEGRLATRQTEVRFLYDDKNLYIGAIMYDDEPDGLIVNELKRDFRGSTSDTFGLVLDVFRDGQTGYGFLTNAGGATRETQVYDNGSNDASWNGVWFCRTAIRDDGWSAEYAIPFKTLRFPNQKEQEWGLQMVRWSRRANEVSVWTPVLRPQRHYTVSEAGLLTGIQAASSGANFRVKPYGKTELDHVSTEGNDFDVDAGVDIKWGLTSSLVLDGTYRTDFSQVEADAQQINLTRFSLFFPEKREFFLESPGSFQIGLSRPGGENRRDFVPFFSRRIGLSQRGQPIPVVGGLRLTGRQGPWGIGVLNMQTEDFETLAGPVRPADNFTAIRMTRDVTPTTALGGFYFGRESDATGAYNRVAGFDLLTQPSRTIRIEAFGMRSTTDGTHDWAGRAGFSYEANTNRAYFFHLYIGDQFRHDLGFVRRGDVGLTFGKYEKILRPEIGAEWVREHTLGVSLETVQDSGYQELQTRVGSLVYDIGFQDGGSLTVNYDSIYELLDEPFDIHPGIIIPTGKYDFGQFRVGYSSNPSSRLSGAVELGGGSFWTGTGNTVKGSIRVRFDSHIAVSGSYERDSVNLPEGAFVTQLETMNLDWSFSPRMFLNAFLQYSPDRNTWLSNVRFNFIHRPLSDIFVVWNETRGPLLSQRSVVVKYTHMFSF